jgi:hypothetical protein
MSSSVVFCRLILLAQLGDAIDPLVVNLGHGKVVEGMAERNQIIDVVVVVTADHDVHHRVEDRRLLHRRLGRGCLDVVLNLFRHFLQAVHVEDLLADFVLVVLDVAVGVDLLGVKVVHHLYRALAEDVLLKNVAERRLRVHGKHQHLVALLRQPEGGRGRESGLSQSAFAAEHDVAPFPIGFECFAE